MNTMLMISMKSRKEQEKQKRTYEQCALGVPLRNSGKLRSCYDFMAVIAIV